MKVRWLISLAAFFLLAAGSSVRADVVYNLAADWSDVANPNGVWSYNQGANPIPVNQSDYAPHFFLSPQPAWALATGGLGHTPSWFKSVTTNTVDPLYDLPIGRVGGHSTDGASLDSAPANITWTSPLSGIATVSGGTWLARNQGRSNDWRLYVNDTLVTGGSLTTGDPYDSSNPLDFAAGFGGPSVLVFPVAVGDTVTFEMVKTFIFGEFQGVDFQVSVANAAVPEPATVTLFAFGGMGLAAACWRSRRRT